MGAIVDLISLAPAQIGSQLEKGNQQGQSHSFRVVKLHSTIGETSAYLVFDILCFGSR